ncbi:MAG: N-acetylmuramoyl-L-alanine amidase, partial [Myxococcales bacterium]
PVPAAPAKPAPVEEKRPAIVEPPKLAAVEPKPVPVEEKRETRAPPLELAPHGDEDDEESVNALAVSPRAAPAGLEKERLDELAKAATANIPLSVQAGLKVKRVVIDPGHGGHDTGAIGPTGVKEKDATLGIALKLKAQLERQGLEVFLTREDDRFVALEDRARFANKRRGDLFLSIHCNAHASPKMRGIETYTLNVTADKYAIRLAARENASTERTVSDLQFILADLATKANTSESRRLAKAVQASLVSAHAQEKARPRDLGVKQALFYVLLGAKMPAVLVETAFLSNPTDEQRLGQDEYQQRLAEAIAQGVAKFVGDRSELAQALTD